MSNEKDSLGDRMKVYEAVPRAHLVRRTPVMMRLDGKAFHTFTRGMPRPYCEWFHRVMWETAKYLCESVQGAQIAYVQSDEITILLTDYADIKTAAWFDYQVQKMCSVAAALCSVAFNYWFEQLKPLNVGFEIGKRNLPVFDCRVWNLPKEEVVNCFVWRQLDATRNAIQMVGQANFSHKQLHGKSCANIQEMLFQEEHINFNDLPVPQKRGVCVVKRLKQHPERMLMRYVWEVDESIPDFRKDRDYVQRLVDQVKEGEDGDAATTS